MKLKAKIASTLLIIDTFFVSFAFGFNSRHVLVVDPTLPAYVPKVEVVPEKADKKDAKVDGDKTTTPKAKPATKDAVKNDSTPTKKTSSPAKSKHGTHAAASSASKPQPAHGTN